MSVVVKVAEHFLKTSAKRVAHGYKPTIVCSYNKKTLWEIVENDLIFKHKADAQNRALELAMEMGVNAVNVATKIVVKK